MLLVSVSLLVLATFFTFNHSIKIAHGTAAQAAERENTRVLETAFAYASRRACNTAGEVAIFVTFDAPASMTTWTGIASVWIETSRVKPFMNKVSPTQRVMALVRRN